AVNHEEAGSGIFGLLPTQPAVGVQHTVSAREIADDQMGRIVVSPVAENEIAARESWRDGKLIFGGKTLAEVVGEFNRYNNLHLVIADPDVANQKVGGMWRTTDVEVFVAAWMAQGNGAMRERGAGDEGEIVMLYGRASK
ncbi:MAG TPA: hypothetical protein VMS40_06525, partial [Vicinamibacterales bacterium]|nr:hypothetical protein [Vicinamibacterales bacterium]